MITTKKPNTAYFIPEI